jgi:pyrroline-5-carboxylate reductase
MRGVKSMKKYNIGFIGCGKMAGAIIKGLLKSGFTDSQHILATQAELEGIAEKSASLGIEIFMDNKILVQKSDVIFLATKPNQVLDVLKEISPYVNSEKLIVSIAAGVRTEKLEANLPLQTRVIRVMPNTPALIGEGMSGIVKGKYSTDLDVDYIRELLSTIGKCIIVDDEPQMDIVTAISGSGPAFFYKLIDDIAKAGQALGLDYEKALLLSIQTAIGSAKMALNREISMEQLVSNVATKGGCTRVGVDVMEEVDTTKIFANVIKQTAIKAKELGD